mmetsp:Transcript_31962/g.95724  ORF Transcript_31962/g.95724 Transcript_31962/m.95724 type:complete len:81 (-) Transcript_31962:2558-2800(-)
MFTACLSIRTKAETMEERSLRAAFDPAWSSGIVELHVDGHHGEMRKERVLLRDTFRRMWIACTMVLLHASMETLGFWIAC